VAAEEGKVVAEDLAGNGVDDGGGGAEVGDGDVIVEGLVGLGRDAGYVRKFIELARRLRNQAEQRRFIGY